MSTSIPIHLVTSKQVQQQYGEHPWVQASQFKADVGSHCLVPGTSGAIDKVLVGRGSNLDPWLLGELAQSLPPLTYYVADELTPKEVTMLCLGWHMGQYRFDTYKRSSHSNYPELEIPDGGDRDYIKATAEAIALVRDLINTPAGDMGPNQLEERARAVADSCGAEFTAIRGDDLLTQNYPMIHAVGRASDQAPRLLDLRWGDPSHPKVTLVGKGVCFDTGGLNVKSSGGMKLMKKDMGGAAQTLGLASMIMTLKLPVRLRLLIPAVENSIAGNAAHPYDVLPSRKGMTVEIGNTDAEGRLVLADALWEASAESPQLLIDCATLTGAARVALGTELPALFCNNDAIANQLLEAGLQVSDPMWRLPLHSPYRSLLDSKVADICNISSGSYGGAIAAALFLQEFVKPNIPWVHVDFMAWNLRSQPGRPEGGEAMGMRALYELIKGMG
ncbi:MAG: leucyl aminopeptidase family protein [Elainellaceae cyanobacterium]